MCGSLVLMFAAIRLQGPRFKPRPGQKFGSRFLLHAHPGHPEISPQGPKLVILPVPISSPQMTRGLYMLEVCGYSIFATRTPSTGPLSVPVPDPYSKLLPEPTRGYTHTRHCQGLCSCQPNRLSTRHVVIV